LLLMAGAAYQFRERLGYAPPVAPGVAEVPPAAPAPIPPPATEATTSRQPSQTADARPEPRPQPPADAPRQAPPATGMTPSRVGDSAANIARLPKAELCRQALDGQQWNASSASKPYVEEAMRSGLTLTDCRALVVADAAPTTAAPAPNTPSAEVKPPSDRRAALPPPVKPDPPAPTEIIFLNMDTTLAKVASWAIGFNQSLAGCIASVPFENKTTLWLGYTGATDSPYIAFSNPNWKSIQVGTYYDIVLDLGDGVRVPAKFGAVRSYDGHGIFRADLNQSFLQSFAGAQEIGLLLNDTLMTRLSMANFDAVRVKLNACRDASRRELRQR